MQYKRIERGIFKARPNRFIAYVDINGKTETVHVKNTGRCRELLTDNAKVILEKSDNPARKTQYDLVAVYKGNKLINMDSQAPNKVFYEWAETTSFFGKINLIRPETTYKDSRFDCYLEGEDDKGNIRKIFVEVKGVTLENNGVVLFPDAPTERGVKHIHSLIDAKHNGYETYIFFVVQMSDVLYFTPNGKTHPEFALSLKKAQTEGVNICAVDCIVTDDSLKINNFLKTQI